MQPSKPYRRIGSVDVAASALARLAPRSLRPAIDQARLDARSVIDGVLGHAPPSFSSSESPMPVPRPLMDIDPVYEVLPRGLGERYKTLRRDVAMITRELRGERPSPVIERRPVSRHPSRNAPAPVIARRRLRVATITRETPDAVTITLEPEGGEAVVFRAGQFLTFHVHAGGAELRRAYSLCTSPLDGKLAVTVKRIEGGRVSAYMNEQLAIGDTLEVLGPSGTFCAPRDASRIVLWAGGSGITPIWSIAQTALRRDPLARVTLVYGNRAEGDIIFRTAIDALADRDPRLEVTHVLAQPSDAWNGRRGMLDRASVASILGELEDAAGAHHFVCGPAGMMDAVREELLSRGVPRERLHEERFQSPADRGAPASELPAEPQLVTLRRGGISAEVRVARTQTVLEAATAAGFPLPFSCAMGGCAACRCKVKDGEIRMDEPNCLTEAEKAEGWVLTCVGHPTRATSLEVG